MPHFGNPSVHDAHCISASVRVFDGDGQCEPYVLLRIEFCAGDDDVYGCSLPIFFARARADYVQSLADAINAVNGMQQSMTERELLDALEPLLPSPVVDSTAAPERCVPRYSVHHGEMP